MSKPAPPSRSAAASEAASEASSGPDRGMPRDILDGDTQLSLDAYIAFLEAVPSENAIARRFISAAHMLARAVLVNTVFVFVRGLDFSWEEAAEMTGDMLNMSRSSVARSVSDVDRLITFWNSNGFNITSIQEVVDQISTLTKERLAHALEEKAAEEREAEEGSEDADQA